MAAPPTATVGSGDIVAGVARARPQRRAYPRPRRLRRPPGRARPARRPHRRHGRARRHADPVRRGAAGEARLETADRSLARRSPLAAQLANPGLRAGPARLAGRAAIAGIGRRRLSTIAATRSGQSAEGEHYLSIGWRRRSAGAARRGDARLQPRIDARRYRRPADPRLGPDQGARFRPSQRAA